MKNKKLNEKLAKWAGFTFEKRGSRQKISELYGMDVIDGYDIVHYPDGDWDLAGDMPDFTDSLDACFKWLVPKLEETKKRTEYSVDFSMPDFGKPANHYWAILQGSHQLVGTGEDKDPALALCLAVEELIDKEAI